MTVMMMMLMMIIMNMFMMVNDIGGCMFITTFFIGRVVGTHMYDRTLPESPSACKHCLCMFPVATQSCRVGSGGTRREMMLRAIQPGQDLTSRCD